MTSPSEPFLCPVCGIDIRQTEGHAVSLEHQGPRVCGRNAEEVAAKLAPERAGREGDTQALPIPNDLPDIQSMVIADIVRRRDLGIKRYGSALKPNNGRNALLDLYEELIDAAMYVKQRLVEDAMVESRRAHYVDEHGRRDGWGYSLGDAHRAGGYSLGDAHRAGGYGNVRPEMFDDMVTVLRPQQILRKMGAVPYPTDGEPIEKLSSPTE